jgi:hypothetical protein
VPFTTFERNDFVSILHEKPFGNVAHELINLINFEFNLLVKLSVELGYVFLSLRL